MAEEKLVISLGAPLKEDRKKNDDMNQEIRVRKHFEEYSSQYSSDVHGTMQEAFQNVGTILNNHLYGTVLDVGNGGVFFYDTNKLDTIIAVDLAYPRELENTEKISFHKGDARDLSFLNNSSVDCVLMQFLLHHVVAKTRKQTDDLLRTVLSESHRVLKPAGRLIIAECVVLPALEFFENVFYSFNSFLLNLFNKPMVKFYSKSGLKEHITSSGFEVTSGENIPFGTKWIPLAPALFPGKFIVPPWLFPTRFYCITSIKRSDREKA